MSKRSLRRKKNIDPSKIGTEEDTQSESGIVVERAASELLRTNIKEYGLSVLEDRMIPSLRDGLKPAQRRLLKSLYDLKAFSRSPMVKSARVTGDCMGKYHPHSEAYDVLVGLMGQNCSLLQGQGNWGSFEDEAAAPRYTECRFNALGDRAFLDYQEMVEEVPNFSGEYLEPIDIPLDIPIFFLNGSKGIGVAIRVDIPNHNLIEVVDAFQMLIKKGDKCTIKDIFKVFHGPDSVYGGRLISSESELMSMYEKGSGQVLYECKYEISKISGNRNLLVIREYCPEFSLKKFQKQLLKLLDMKLISEINDSSTKDEHCKFEVVYNDPEVFEKYIHKMLICSQTVQYYAILRTPSADPDLRDVDTRLITSYGLLDFMKEWLKWRRERESVRLKNKICYEEEELFKLRCRLSAIKKFDRIKESLKMPNVVLSLMESIPELSSMKDRDKAKHGAEYISNLKISSLQKSEIVPIEKGIKKYEKEIQNLNSDLNNIDRVIFNRLSELKQFGRQRRLTID